MNSSSLILPGNPLFDQTLAIPPPNWQEVAERHNTWAFVADAESGILRTASPDELTEYLYGGEYEETIEEEPIWDELNEEWLYPEEECDIEVPEGWEHWIDY